MSLLQSVNGLEIDVPKSGMPKGSILWGCRSSLCKKDNWIRRPGEKAGQAIKVIERPFSANDNNGAIRQL